MKIWWCGSVFHKDFPDIDIDQFWIRGLVTALYWILEADNIHNTVYIAAMTLQRDGEIGAGHFKLYFGWKSFTNLT